MQRWVLRGVGLLTRELVRQLPDLGDGPLELLGQGADLWQKDEILIGEKLPTF